MKAFIKCLLGYTGKDLDISKGVLGVVKAHYGCIKAQGRGMLHCHMMVWLEGALNPNEIKQWINDGGDVHNFIPDLVESQSQDTIMLDGFHAARVHGCHDIHNLVIDCQVHKHSKTFYKYWQYPEPKVCRFNLDKAKVCKESSFDYNTSELCLRCLDGLVNNFNETILHAVQCNMDIKFIGSGASAKVVLHYITDYITNSQLKTHVTYAALELSIQKLGEYDPQEDDISVCVKKLLQKWAYTMLTHQELSAHNHNFKSLYWISFEKCLDSMDPSPECTPSKDVQITVNNINDEEPDKSCNRNQEHATDLTLWWMMTK
ncbi:hypothetical protein ARMGADRAFT_1047954 [Armillaria gallica]|uniref:Helitron helicase-like domain-containing protein n=1 Tax=Armillaria gallica TaxID=47427 RepID=A0A2H3CSG6_ARMGA|nr:hypothetical protein ARMGADRAFT_1047954 [Armillaria gallica]